MVILLPHGPGRVGREGSGIIAGMKDGRDCLLLDGDIVDPVVEIPVGVIEKRVTMTMENASEAFCIVSEEHVGDKAP